MLLVNNNCIIANKIIFIINEINSNYSKYVNNYINMYNSNLLKILIEYLLIIKNSQNFNYLNFEDCKNSIFDLLNLIILNLINQIYILNIQLMHTTFLNTIIDDLKNYLIDVVNLAKKLYYTKINYIINIQNKPKNNNIMPIIPKIKNYKNRIVIIKNRNIDINFSKSYIII